MNTRTTTERFEVGGCVRDSLMGKDSKDVDFVCIAPSFEAMRADLIREGFTIWQERPEFVTIRAGVPEGHVLRGRTKDADFVLARKDGPTADGRRPEFVEPGTLADDLARRDFTVNAIARAADGTLTDPHGGVADIEAGTLRFVGDPMERIEEDGLRVVRGFRFMVTKGLRPTVDTWDALCDNRAASMLRLVALERIRDELERMFTFDTLAALALLGDLPPLTRRAMFRGSLRLAATLAR